MNKLAGSYLAMGLFVSGSLSSLAGSTTVDSAESSPKITIHVSDYAQVSPAILAQAEIEVSRVFGKAGIEILWLDNSPREQSRPEPRPTLMVQVCNVARVSDRILNGAKKQAARILREAKVETIWLDCPPAGADPARKPRSHLGAGPEDFSLRILDQVPPERPAIRYEALGFALPCSEGATGCLSCVFWHRVEELAKYSDASESQILGHAMAHEIGHLLLGPNHVPAGGMKAKWDRRDLRSAAWQQLGFTPQQSELIRDKVLVRQAGEPEADLSSH